MCVKTELVCKASLNKYKKIVQFLSNPIGRFTVKLNQRVRRLDLELDLINV